METGKGMRPFLRVLMLPWLAHGHISPFLELAKKLSTNNIAVYLCSTPVNLSSSVHLDVKAFPLIHLVPIHLPADDQLTPHLHTTKNLPSHLMPALKTAFDGAAPTFARLLDSISPHLLIYDFLQPWAPLAASRCCIPAVLFLAEAAAAISFFCHQLLRSDTEQFPFPAMRFDSHKILARVANGVSDGERLLQCIDRSSIVAVRTFREMEAECIDYLSNLTGKEILPVGSIVSADIEGGGREEEWLSRREPGSVVFASVGSEYFMGEEEMEEMARGLELSGLSYIWVVRFPSKDDGVGTRSGFRAGLSGRGLVVEGWAEQKKILAHRSVGGFVTHCGWSSVLEGMRMGVAMIALPMQLDQPLNAKLMVELGVAVEVEQGAGGFRGEELARCVREVAVGEEGECVRRRAKEMASLMDCKGDEEIKVLVERMAALVSAKENVGASPPLWLDADNAAAMIV